jgi:hypothetical protein
VPVEEAPLELPPALAAVLELLEAELLEAELTEAELLEAELLELEGGSEVVLELATLPGELLADPVDAARVEPDFELAG